MAGGVIPPFLGDRPTVTPGDWVHSYSPGIWQVYRVLRDVNRPQFEQSSRRKKRLTVVFSKRLATADWQPAFAAECCDPSGIRPLSPSELERVNHMLEKRPELDEAFRAYAPDSISLIFNLTMSVPDRSVLDSFARDRLAPVIEKGITLDQLRLMMEEAGLAGWVGQAPINATLQLVSRDHELAGGEFVFRDWRVLPF